jgi:hypothetical protein
MAALQYEDYPLELILDELNIRFPDITVSFNMINFQGIGAAPDMEAVEPPPGHMEKLQGVKFDLALFVTEHQHSIDLLWNYRKSLFHPGTVESITNVYLELLSELSEDEEDDI